MQSFLAQKRLFTAVLGSEKVANPVFKAVENRLSLSTTLSFSQEVACSADLQLHAPYWPEANKPHGNRLSHANREDGMCEDILVDKVVLVTQRC